MQSHTILLLQPVREKSSRTFYEYPSVPKAVEGVITIFEGVLKTRQRQNTQITYSAADLHAWLDTLPAAGVLVFDTKSQMYSPRALDWLKAETLSFLKKQAGGGGGGRR